MPGSTGTIRHSWIMKIEPFKLERFFAEYEFKTPYLLCCSDCESVSIGDLLQMEPDSEAEFKELELGYTEAEGHPRLRELIAETYDGVEPDQILVHSGAEEAIFNLMNAVLDPGDHIVVHAPCYQSLMEVASALGCRVSPWLTVEQTGWSLDLDLLKKILRPNTRMVVVNNPHNPTGSLASRDVFEGLVELSQKRGIMIFSDEVYRCLEYEREDRLPSICEVDDRGVALGVMSKSYGLAGLRIGWIATRNRVVYEKMAAYKDYTTICNSAPSEFLSMLALKHRERLVSRNLGIIRNNLLALDGFFQRHQDCFRWTFPRAGPIAFPSLVDGHASSFCRDLIDRAGVLLLPGALYGDYMANVRIGFGRVNMMECLGKLDEYLQSS